MNKSILIIGLFFGIGLPVISKGQTITYVGHYLEKDNIKHDTLVDKINGTKFIIDKQRIYVSAVNKSGKLLWRTDPASDNKLEEYRTKRPIIIFFSFNSEQGKQVIEIQYNNSQAGYLDKETGKFYFRGQD